MLYTIHGYIYLLTNKLNGKMYIGKTTNYKRRMNEYKNRQYKDSSKYYITKIINEYGYDNFKSEIIDVGISAEDLSIKESHYIRKYKTDQDEYGYNSRAGGLKRKLNTRTRNLMSESHTGLTETSETKRKKSNKIIAFRDDECIISDSGKLFGDYIERTRAEVSHAIKKRMKISKYYVFYMDDDLRYSIGCKDNDEYRKYYELIDETVEAIERLYDIKYLLYD